MFHIKKHLTLNTNWSHLDIKKTFLAIAIGPTVAALKEFEKRYGSKNELWLSFCLDTTPRLAAINTTCGPTRAVANA